MTCIKTGARVYLPDYGLYTPADLFEVGGAIIARFPRDPRDSNEYFKEAPKGTTHIITVNPPATAEVWFDRAMVIVHPYNVLEM